MLTEGPSLIAIPRHILTQPHDLPLGILASGTELLQLTMQGSYLVAVVLDSFTRHTNLGHDLSNALPS